MKVLEAVKEYQCPGCVIGIDGECYEYSKGSLDKACPNHVPGTWRVGIGKIFLGMPKGFNKIGLVNTTISIFKYLSDGWGFDKFNVPVWKYKDKQGNILVRGYLPRLNIPFIHIYLCDCIEYINCIEITSKDLEEMD